MDINKTEMLYGLYGSHVKRSKAIGYCRHHCAALTVNTLKCHECLKKQCAHLKKYEDHDYWKERERIKALKNARKNQALIYVN